MVLLLFLLPSMITDLKTFRFITDRHLKKDWDTPEALQSTPMNDFRFVRYGTRWLEMRAYMAELTEGIQLLRRHASPEMRLDALMAADPLAQELDRERGLPGARGAHDEVRAAGDQAPLEHGVEGGVPGGDAGLRRRNDPALLGHWEMPSGPS